MIMALGFSVNACPDCPATGIAFSVPLLHRLFWHLPIIVVTMLHCTCHYHHITANHW